MVIKKVTGSGSKLPYDHGSQPSPTCFAILVYIFSQKPVGVLQCYLEFVATYFYRQNRTSSIEIH